MSLLRRFVFSLLILLLPPALACAQSAEHAPATKEQVQAYMKGQAAKLHPRHGAITLGGNLASLALPEGFDYLTPEDTEILLHTIWQNPPGTATLGAILPSGADVLSPSTWAVIITYSDDGHIKDDDAATINPDTLLESMKKSEMEQMQQRREQGYPTFQLSGWAAKPHYDAAAHKFYWAIAITPDNGGEEEVNYDIRILGRQGYLVLSIIGPLSQLPAIEARKDAILSLVNFSDKQRYSDFNPDTDKVAAYGMAALVAGYAAAKVGMFKAIIPLLIAAKKFILLGFFAVMAFFKGIFKRKRQKDDTTR